MFPLQMNLFVGHKCATWLCNTVNSVGIVLAYFSKRLSPTPAPLRLLALFAITGLRRRAALLLLPIRMKVIALLLLVRPLLSLVPEVVLGLLVQLVGDLAHLGKVVVVDVGLGLRLDTPMQHHGQHLVAAGLRDLLGEGEGGIECRLAGDLRDALKLAELLERLPLHLPEALASSAHHQRTRLRRGPRHDLREVRVVSRRGARIPHLQGARPIEQHGVVRLVVQDDEEGEIVQALDLATRDEECLGVRLFLDGHRRPTNRSGRRDLAEVEEPLHRLLFSDEHMLALQQARQPSVLQVLLPLGDGKLVEQIQVEEGNALIFGSG